jgi:ketosteroid isomerase-like protein
MSLENVEIVRRAFEAWSALDVGAMTTAFDPDVRWHIAEDEPDAHIIEGVPGIVRSLRSWAESFDDFRAEPQNLIHGGDYVVVPLVFRGRARHTAATMGIEETQVYLVKDGKIVEVRVFRRVEDALEAVGLTEQDAT